MSDDFTRGFLEGVEVAARIFRNHISATRQECPRCGPPDADVSQQASRDQGCPAERGRPEMPLSGPESPADASHLVTESDSGGSEYPADHPQPMVVYTPPAYERLRRAALKGDWGPLIADAESLPLTEETD